jgi:hypothetical protein
MKSAVRFDIEDVLQLYGSKVYRVGTETFELELEPDAVPHSPVATVTPADLAPEVTSTPPPLATKAITWRLKKTAPSVLFVLQTTEFGNKQLTDLLKKIVESLGIEAERVSFGAIDGVPSLSEFDDMPAKFAIVFDQTLFASSNPQPVAAGEVFFSHPLSVLSTDNDLKRVLWSYLKQIQPKLS